MAELDQSHHFAMPRSPRRGSSCRRMCRSSPDLQSMYVRRLTLFHRLRAHIACHATGPLPQPDAWNVERDAEDCDAAGVATWADGDGKASDWLD